jgi:hypothetical protein
MSPENNQPSYQSFWRGRSGSFPGTPHSSMAARVGISATISRQSRQARKGATVTVRSGAGEAPARAVSLIGKSRRGAFFETALRRPPAKSVVFAGYVVAFM